MTLATVTEPTSFPMAIATLGNGKTTLNMAKDSTIISAGSSIMVSGRITKSMAAEPTSI